MHGNRVILHDKGGLNNFAPNDLSTGQLYGLKSTEQGNYNL